MKVTSKGQVTIPIEIRSLLGILPNSEVEFIEKSGNVILRKKASDGKRGAQLIEALRGKSTLKLSTDQIMDLTRGSGSGEKWQRGNKKP